MIDIDPTKKFKAKLEKEMSSSYCPFTEKDCRFDDCRLWTPYKVFGRRAKVVVIGLGYDCAFKVAAMKTSTKDLSAVPQDFVEADDGA